MLYDTPCKHKTIRNVDGVTALRFLSKSLCCLHQDRAGYDNPTALGYCQRAQHD